MRLPLFFLGPALFLLAIVGVLRVAAREEREERYRAWWEERRRLRAGM